MERAGKRLKEMEIGERKRARERGGGEIEKDGERGWEGWR